MFAESISKGSGASLSFPIGWRTFGLSASSNRYGQTVTGEVTDFATRGKLDGASAWLEQGTSITGGGDVTVAAGFCSIPKAASA